MLAPISLPAISFFWVYKRTSYFEALSFYFPKYSPHWYACLTPYLSPKPYCATCPFPQLSSILRDGDPQLFQELDKEGKFQRNRALHC